MLKQTTENRPVVVIKDVICNKCGQSCRVEWGPVDDEEPSFQFVELKTVWGEEEMHRAHVCEQCYRHFVATFLIPPEVSECRLGLSLEDPFEEE